MNKIFSKFSFIMMITLSGVSLAGEKVNQVLSVETTGIVLVDIPRGLVKIEGWDKPEVMVKGYLDDTMKQLIFKTKKNKTLIKIETEGQEHWGDASVIKIFMPQQLDLRFKGVDTSFSLANLNSDIDGKSIHGDLMVKKSNGKINLSVISGNVRLVKSSGFTKIESVSGTVDFSGDFEQAFLESISGEIIAEVSGTNKLTIKNTSGDTQISGLIKKNAQLKLSSVSGDILYKVTDQLNAMCEVVSQFGGEINNQLNDHMPTDGTLHKKTLSFMSGDGSSKLYMSTVNGSVTIEKVINE